MIGVFAALLRLCSFLLTSFLVITSGVAATLSPATFSIVYSMPGEHLNLSGLPAPISYSGDALYSGSQSVFTVDQSGGTAPTIVINADSSVFTVSGNPENRSAYVDVSSNIVYSMQIAGPVDTILPISVSTIIDLNGYASTGNSTNNWAKVSGSVSILGYANWNASSYWNTACPVGTATCVENGGSYVSDTQILYLNTNTEYLVSMVADVYVYASTSSTGLLLTAQTTADLAVDPVFTFYDPNDAASYSFEFSSNLATVPVPPAVWLFGSGLLGLASVARRKKIA